MIVVSGELWTAIAFCQEYPIAYALFIMRSLVVYLGVLCFVALIKTFGVVVATTVTTIRKILTIIMSFIIFPKPWNVKHVGGLLLFAVSVSVNIQVARNKQKGAQPPQK